MNNSSIWKYALILGAGLALGAAGAIFLSRRNANLRKTLAGLLSHGLDLRDKAAEFMETAKENAEDLAAEARQEQTRRKTGEQPL